MRSWFPWMHLKVGKEQGGVAKGGGEDAARQQRQEEAGDASFEETGEESFEEGEEGLWYYFNI